MRSKTYIDTIIDEIKQQANAIQSKKDFFAFYQWMLAHQNFIDSLKELDNLPLPLSNESLIIENSNPITEIPNPVSTADSREENNITSEKKVIGQTFSFFKKAFGGCIEELNYHLNEEIVRRYQIEHGNLILIKGIEGRFPDGKPRYSFEVVDRSTTINEKLQYVTQGIVENIDGQYVVRKTTFQNIQLEDKDIILNIQQRDVEKHQLQQGDIIDGRFYDNSINSFRITQKYDIENNAHTTTPIESSKLLRRKKYKESKKINESLSMLDRLDTHTLAGKRILLVGLASRKKDFQSMLAKYPHIQLAHLTGDESTQSIRSAIAESDLVLINITENSHRATKLVTSICKEINVPVTSTSSDGLYMLLYSAKAFSEQIKRQKTKSS